jgi:hypothetical protein
VSVNVKRLICFLVKIVFLLRQLFIKPDFAGLENGGLVPYFQVVSLELFSISMIDYHFRSKKKIMILKSMRIKERR